MTTARKPKPERESFLSKWEKVIKGTYVSKATPLRPTRGVKSRRKASVLREKPARDRAYRAFVRTFACVACWKGDLRMRSNLVESMPTECAHVGQTGKGMSVKCSDYETLPLCVWHHTAGPLSHHRMDGGAAAFFRFFKIKPARLFVELQKRYAMERSHA